MRPFHLLLISIQLVPLALFVIATHTEFHLNPFQARAIGVSNYCQSCLHCLTDETSGTKTDSKTDSKTEGTEGEGEGVVAVEPAVNQVQWHVGMGPNPESLPRYCDEHNIILQAYVIHIT